MPVRYAFTIATQTLENSAVDRFGVQHPEVTAETQPEVSQGKPEPIKPVSEVHSQIMLLQARSVPYSEWPEHVLWRYFKAILTIAQHPCTHAVRQELLVRYEPWVKSLANSYAHNRLPKNVSVVDAGDLTQAALMAVWNYLPSFDPHFGTNFQQYAYTRVIGAIIDELRSVQDYPRDISPARREIHNKSSRLRSKLMRGITLEELLEHHPELTARVRDNLVWTRVVNQAEIVDQSSGERITVLNTIADYRKDEEAEKRAKLLARMDSVLDSLEDQNMHTVIYNYYYIGMPQAEIAVSLDINVATVVSLKKRAEKKIKDVLGRNFFRNP